MPEEHNRVLTDHLADLCCAPTETSRAQLAAEGIDGARVVVTGNTVVDAAHRMLPVGDERAELIGRFGLETDGYVLSTFHRPENVDDEDRLRAILAELATFPVPVLLPLHPRTRARLSDADLDTLGPIRVVEPVGYREFLGLAAGSAFLVSDSGGVQEEASIVKRPVLVVRALHRAARGARDVLGAAHRHGGDRQARPRVDGRPGRDPRPPRRPRVSVRRR